MGVLVSKKQNYQREISRKIDKEMQTERRFEERRIKLLLLGIAECGKTTILKQMKIIYNKGFSEEEITEKKTVIYSNTLLGMANILQAMESLDINIDDPKNEEAKEVIQQVVDDGDDMQPWTDEVYSALKGLWSDSGVKKCFQNRHLYHLDDSVCYLLKEMDRIHEPGYKPTDDDILRTRVATTGVNSITFSRLGRDLIVYDPGGHRSERRKWIHIFDNVKGIIYISALSEYNLTLTEDHSVNGLIESLTQFSCISKNPLFRTTSIMLFLNKKDIFKEKILSGISINETFPEYSGPTRWNTSN